MGDNNNRAGHSVDNTGYCTNRNILGCIGIDTLNVSKTWGDTCSNKAHVGTGIETIGTAVDTAALMRTAIHTA